MNPKNNPICLVAMLQLIASKQGIKPLEIRERLSATRSRVFRCLHRLKDGGDIVSISGAYFTVGYIRENNITPQEVIPNPENRTRLGYFTRDDLHYVDLMNSFDRLSRSAAV